MNEPAALAEPLLVSAADAARMLAVCTKTLWALTKSGQLRAVHVGPRGIRYSLSDLREFVEAAKQPGGAKTGACPSLQGAAPVAVEART